MIVNGHNGYLIPLFDYQLFQEKLNELMTNDEKRAELSSKSINSINKFSSDIVCESFYSFITDI
jgi:glycosyltransferase involved in cell wall biosynthesis